MAKKAVSDPDINPERNNNVNSTTPFTTKPTVIAKSGLTTEILSIKRRWQKEVEPGSKESLILKNSSAKLLKLRATWMTEILRREDRRWLR